jgi:hydrogenase nickel incorporation protein HypA/HybF
MHEMSLAEGALQIIVQAGREQGFSRVKTVWLEIGRLACVEPDAMRFCFESVVAGTLAEGAKLEIIESIGQGLCEECHKELLLSALYEACPHCGGYRVRVTGGDVMRVHELEVV